MLNRRDLLKALGIGFVSPALPLNKQEQLHEALVADGDVGLIMPPKYAIARWHDSRRRMTSIRGYTLFGDDEYGMDLQLYDRDIELANFAIVKDAEEQVRKALERGLRLQYPEHNIRLTERVERIIADA